MEYDYQDLFLVKQEFEDGDIIADEEGNIAIFKNYTKENKFSFYVELFCSKLYFDNEDIIDNCHLASEREKQKLFVALEKEGKHWNAETKQVEDIKPKCTLQPFDKVLVRDSDFSNWQINLFCSYNKNINCKYICFFLSFRQCIPYNDETKNLLGTSDDAPKKYKTW